MLPRAVRELLLYFVHLCEHGVPPVKLKRSKGNVWDLQLCCIFADHPTIPRINFPAEPAASRYVDP